MRGGLHGGEHAEQTHGWCLRVRGDGSSATLPAVISGNTSAGRGPEEVPRLATRWVLARVSGPSMSPTVRHGDRLLVRRLRAGAAVREGDVVLARFPARPELLVVKRVRRAVEGGHWVEGDNPFVADDSRAFGAAAVVGRVVGRLWPRPGRLAPGPPASGSGAA
ncbi:S26 family signal peptidase [Blastococcus sp. KM273129]|nr:S26 family signal peptidase [Blastococcus sp. KM273129]